MNTAVDARRSGGTGADATRSAASTAELARTALQHAARLARAEARAGLAELEPKLRDAGTGVALLGVAGVTVCYGIAALLASVMLLLALFLPRWAAALVVTVALVAAATVAALVGLARLRRTRPLVPDRTAESIRSDLRVIGTAVRRPRGATAGAPRAPVDAALLKATPQPKAAPLPLPADPPATPVTRTSAASADAPAVARISDSVRRRPAWWAVVGAGMVAAGSAVAVLRRRRVRRTPTAPAVRAWRAVVGRPGR